MRIVFALAPDIEERLLGAAIAHRHEIVARPAGAAEITAVVTSLRPDALLVSAPALRPSIVEAADEHTVRLVAIASTAAERAHAEDLGAVDVVDAMSGWDAIESVLLGGRGAEPAPVERGAGRVVAVWGPTGAPGRTTLAVGVAAELAATGRRVLLIDADTHGAAVAPSLGLLDEASGIAAACRLAAAGGLDLAGLDRISTAVPVPAGSLRVLTGISRPARWPELSGDRVSEVIRAARHFADVVVIDAGFNLERDEEIVSDLFAPHRNAATLASLTDADHVVAVGAADPIGLARLLREHAELLEDIAPTSVSVVVNKVRAAAIGIDHRRQIVGALQRFGSIADAHLLPLDQRAVDAALAAGRSVIDVAPKSAIRVALSRFVETELLPALAGRNPPVRAAAPVSRFAPV
ncbi:regulator [Herbiconiux sp. L3-i23]|uniref:AAA family ATPase n=1 Tax=Herbiconiux sp. L3-i23 TaxID=2905871 RepID=UPI002059E899|nr:regulator [Herbiconiux sp. L3-i23]BDI21700.1 pilus biosynthesis protein CpaE [Herbiconiux sp. L3-i23]